MGLQFVIGRAGSGKSAHCLREIGDRLRAEPKGNELLLVVPEQATFQAEQALAGQPGLAGFIRAQVFSFRRLAWRAMQELGHTAAVPISDLGKTMLLAQLLHKHEPELQVFRETEGKLGVAQSLNQLFSDLRRSGLTPGGLRASQAAVLTAGAEGTDVLSDKLTDIALLYQAYEHELSERFLDADSFLDRLASGIAHLPCLREAEVWVDGFYGFSPQEREVLAQLAVYCKQVTVTLTLDRPFGAGERPDEYHLFHSTGKAMARLTSRAAELGAELDEPLLLGDSGLPRYADSPMLAHLERSYELRSTARRAVYPGKDTGSIVLAGGVHRRAEVEGCAREILHLVRDDKRRFRDVAVRVRNMGDYGELISQVFADYGIPHFLDQRRPVKHHPLIEFIRSALEVVERDWPYEAVFRLVKTGLLLSEEDEQRETVLAWGAGGEKTVQAAEPAMDVNSLAMKEVAAGLDLPLSSRRQAEDGAPLITRRSMDLLENYVLARGIHGYRWKDDKTWAFHKPLPLEDDAAFAASTQGDAGSAADAEEERKRTREQLARLAAPDVDVHAGANVVTAADVDASAVTSAGAAADVDANPGRTAATNAAANATSGSGANADSDPHPPLSAEGQTDESRGTPEELAQHREITAARDRLVGILSGFEQALKRADTVLAKTEALYRLLADSGIAERLERQANAALAAGRPEEAREMGQIWDYVIDLFDQLTELMGGELMDNERYAGLLDAGLEGMCLGLVPPALDQVLVGSMDRTRTTQKLYSFVLGANEGVLPARPEEDGLLSDAERLRLEYAGVELPGGTRRKLLDEQLLIYSTLCSPSHYLWVSYALADDEGKALLPSEIVRQLGQMFPGVKLRERLLQVSPPVSAAAEEAADYLSHSERAITDLGVQLKGWQSGESLSPIWWDVYNWFAARPEWASRLKQLDRSLHYRIAKDRIMPATARLLYGDTLRASVSRMERFAACPFSHFSSHGLRLAERKLFRLAAPDIGQLYHAALSQVIREILADGSEDWADLKTERMAERAGSVVERLIPRLQSEILLSSNRYRYIARKLKDIVTRASAVIADHARGNGFYPVELELAFGPGETLPPLSFQLEDGSWMEIAGRIDRVDRADGETGMFLRVIDYKSSPHSLELTDLYNGLSLQMLTYLDVVVTHSRRWLGQQATPAGVLYFHVHNPLLAVANGLDAATAEAELARSFRMKGLLLADKEAIGLMDSKLKEEAGGSAIIPIGIKKDGDFRKGSPVASREQWDLMRGHVRHTIRSIGSGIMAGKAEIEPYRHGQKEACAFCPYKSVCQIDPALPGGEFRSFPTLTGEGIWQAMNETAAADGKTDEDTKGGSKP